MEQKTIYCILCGQENQAGTERCVGCGQPMEQKDENQIKEFAGKKVKEGIKDKVKEEAGNLFTSWLSKLVNSQLYGLLLSFSIIASAGTVMAAGNGINEFTGELPVETAYGQQALYASPGQRRKELGYHRRVPCCRRQCRPCHNAVRFRVYIS